MGRLWNSARRFLSLLVLKEPREVLPEACPTHPAAASSFPADGVSSKKTLCWDTPTATPGHKSTFVLVPSTLNTL